MVHRLAPHNALEDFTSRYLPLFYDAHHENKISKSFVHQTEFVRNIQRCIHDPIYLRPRGAG